MLIVPGDTGEEFLEGLGSGLQDKRDLGKLRRKRHYWKSKQLKALQRRNEHGSVKVMQG